MECVGDYNLGGMDGNSKVSLIPENMNFSISLSSPKPNTEDSYDAVSEFLNHSNKKNFVCLSLLKGCDLNATNKKNFVVIQDVVRDFVLPFLPAKSLTRCKLVSKEWCRKIQTPFLAHQQSFYFKHISGFFRQSSGEKPSFISLDQDAYGVPSSSLSFLPEPVDLITTCNGLLCCRSRLGDLDYYICNPATKEWRILPKPILYHGPETAVALAFEPTLLNFASHYELVCAVTLMDQEVLCFEIYSSRSDSWRCCETVCSEPEGLALNVDGSYMKGIVYWETKLGAVLAFHVMDEEYGIIDLPWSCGPTGALTVIRGELSYLLPSRQEDGTSMVKVYGDVGMSLKWEFHLNLPAKEYNYEFCQVKAFVNDDTLILVLGEKVIAYNVREQTVKQLSDARTDRSTRYLPYVNSIVPVSDPTVAFM